MKTMLKLTTLCLLVAMSVIALAARSPWMPSQEPAPATWNNTKTAKPILPSGNGKLQITLYSNVVPSAPGTPECVKYDDVIYTWVTITDDLWVYCDEEYNAIAWNTTSSRWEDINGNPIDGVEAWTKKKPPEEK